MAKDSIPLRDKIVVCALVPLLYGYLGLLSVKEQLGVAGAVQNLNSIPEQERQNRKIYFNRTMPQQFRHTIGHENCHLLQHAHAVKKDDGSYEANVDRILQDFWSEVQNPLPTLQ